MRTAFFLYFLTIFQIIAAILIEHFLHLVLRHQDSLVLRHHRRTHASTHCIFHHAPICLGTKKSISRHQVIVQMTSAQLHQA